MITCYENEQKKESKVRLSKLISFFLLNLLDHEHITTDMIPESITTLINENLKEHDIQKLNEKIANKELSK